ncbi:MAG: tRNA (guanosine(37)-N1)-methyltransferase TrmD [Acidobacteria bacterium]|nr:MAG: tRNA (guanosine(37)-N1)-methyltransferase TrmD [Acidobacteriota bacterium]
MKIDCLSIFPELLTHALGFGVIGRACQRGLIQLHQHDIRSFTTDKHQRVDDLPYGGGAGMVFKPEPVTAALKSVQTQKALVIHPSPSAPLFTQEIAQELSSRDHLIFIASRYEGLDQRVIDHHVHREYSLGDYVISGGELAVAVMVDAIIRLVPGVLGNPESSQTESYSDGLLEHPHYTRPAEFEGHKVPEVLQNGHHTLIEQWRKRESLKATWLKRPDLLEKRDLSLEEKRILHAIEEETTDRQRSSDKKEPGGS